MAVDPITNVPEDALLDEPTGTVAPAANAVAPEYVRFFFTDTSGLAAQPRQYRRHPLYNWVEWGDVPLNLLPQAYILLYHESPTHGGIVNSKREFISGKKAIYPKGQEEFASWADNVLNGGQGLHELVDNLALDFIATGNYSLKCIWHPDGDRLLDVVHEDVTMLRRGYFNRQAKDSGLWEQAVHRCWDWLNWSIGWPEVLVPVAYNVFDPQTPRPGECTYHWVYDSAPGQLWYGLPTWFSGFASIRAEADTIATLGGKIKRVMAPGGIVDVPMSVSPENALKMENEINGIVGPLNAGRVIVARNPTDRAINFAPFASSVTQDGLKEADEIIVQKIVTAHGLSSPAVAGLPGGPSLSGDATTIAEARLALQAQMIAVRGSIIRELKKLFAYCGWPYAEFDFENQIFIGPQFEEEGNQAEVASNPALDQLRASVGGIQLVSQIQSDVAAGLKTVAAARALLQDGFGYSIEEVLRLVPETLYASQAPANPEVQAQKSLLKRLGF